MKEEKRNKTCRPKRFGCASRSDAQPEWQAYLQLDGEWRVYISNNISSVKGYNDFTVSKIDK